MLSADNYVQDPLSTQSFNRYSYVLNNPLTYADPDGSVPVVVLVYAGAAVIGGGLNLWSNWGKAKDFKTGVGYFLSGAIGGVVSVKAPGLGGSITAGVNVGLDLATGNVPKFDNAWDVAKYAGGVALDGLSVAGAGKLSKFGFSKISPYFSNQATLSVAGAYNSATTVGYFSGGFESVANWELVIRPTYKIGSTLTSQGIRQGVNVLDDVGSTSTRVLQKHHIIPNEVYKSFKTDLKAMGWKQNDIWNLKKLPTPFHGNHPAYNKFVMNEMNTLQRSGNLNLNSMHNLQHKMRLMIGDAYRSGGTLNHYFRP